MSQSERWDEARLGLGLRLALLLGAFLWARLFAEMGQPELDLGLMCLLLAGGLLLPALSLATRLPASVVGAAQVAVVTVVLAGVWHVTRQADAISLLATPALLGAFLLPGWLAAILTLTLAATVLTVVDPVTVSAGGMALAILAAGGIGLLASDWARRQLADAWEQGAEAVALARQVRLRQEEVNRLNKALRVSNGLLRRSLNELAAAQREATEARQLKEQFATTVSHELRTPLNIILGFVEVMQRYPEVYTGAVWTPAQRRDVGEIQRSARYLSELIDDVLDLARLQALKMPMRRENCDLSTLISQAIGLASRLLVEKQTVRLVQRVPEGLPLLFIDPTRLRQVLLNLLANACRFTETGEVVVSAGIDAGEVVVSVADTGPGISASDLKHIFEEFQQSEDAAIEPRQAGKGLGLAIARRFVQMHGGRMWVESAVGLGSTFYFSLPLQEKQVVQLGDAPAGSQGNEGAEQTVVVVGGAEEHAYLSRHLEGYAILAAADVEEGRRMALQEHSQALVVTQSAAGVDGSESLTAGWSDPLPVVQCGLPITRSYVGGGLFAEWLVKPVDGDALMAAVQSNAPAGTVLVVDDDPGFVRLVRRVLEAQAGERRVVWAYNGADALALLKSEPIAVVLLDVALPGMNGHAVAERIRQDEAYGRPSVIAVTAQRPEAELRGLAARSFCVSSALGLSEEDNLVLLRACLSQLRTGYPPVEPSEALPAAESATQAS